MLDVIFWYAALQLIGLAALPLSFRLLGRLPDAGYAFARPTGLLAVGYGLWLGGSLGLLDNHPVTAALLVVALALGSWLGLRGRGEALGAALRRRRSSVVLTEVLFLGTYLGWCAVRAYVPDIAATEKPMEFAFLNAILRSEQLPPADPWLAGYSISYYYFGYLLAAILASLSGVASGVAFNLMLATLFALTATGAFSVGLNLVAAIEERRPTRLASSPSARAASLPHQSRPRPGSGRSAPAPEMTAETQSGEAAPGPGAWIAGAFAAVFVLWLANWEGFLEMLHARGLGSPGFWRRVGIKGLESPFVSEAWHPTEQQSTWWWFRAARVIADYGPDGRARDYTINEFPSFSFLLGDLHPHVLALPFTFLAIAFALSLLRSAPGDWTWLHASLPLPSWLNWARRSRLLRFLLANLAVYPLAALRRWPVEGVAVAVVFGGLGFLNAWDLPTYLIVLVGAFALQRYLARPGLDAVWRKEVATFAWLTLFASLIAYLPFYVGFRSQTSGLGVVGYRSQLHHFLIFWGPLLVVVTSLLIVELRRTAIPGRLGPAALPTFGDWTRLPGVWPWVGAVSVVLLTLQLPPLAARLPFWVQAPALAVAIPLLAASAALVWRYLGAPAVAASGGKARQEPAAAVGPRGARPTRIAGGAVPASLAPEHVFVFFLAFVGLLLVSGTELLFIRDLFGNRMNTVFKLYYQAWTLLAIVAAYGLHYLASRWPRPSAPAGARLGAALWLAAVVVALAAGLVYAPAALASRASAAGGPPTLDGTAYLARTSPADYAAIQWLQRNVSGNPTIVEAPGGSYSQFGRISANTGLPTLLGWDFHEAQWRGSYEEQRRRQLDLDLIYGGDDRALALSLLRRYGVTYVYVGPLEVEKYGRTGRASLDKFAGFMDVVYQADGVTIFKLRGP